MNEGMKRISREKVFSGKIFDVAEDTIRLPNGQITKWDMLLHDGAAAVVPIDNNGKIVLVEQYRGVEDGKVLEIPAGKLDENEDPKQCAVRELEEETGYKAKNIEFLFSIYSAVGFSDEIVEIYIAHGLDKGEINLDPDEYVNVKKYTLEDLVNMIIKGEIKDSKTISAVLLTNELVRSGEIVL